ncbi:sensor histidine kinase [Histidinibacterium lentulum]|uniref:histidine kinase n=1 Tax=Histidinibacterium lentulum TaxID=2480588 RepID=A0A3N2R9C7_9RHOB|nr:HWE histidine kinase domain-containing protein [Histidinibacterium lentulum]ROU04074.1 PAS domain-containing protein [Histidinibacterium lentulum]
MNLDDLYRLLRTAHAQAQGVMDTVRDPLLVLDSNLTVLAANPAFYRTFDTDRESTIDIPFTELGDGHWAIEELRLLLEKVIPRSASLFDYEVTADFPHIGRRTMLVSAQRLVHPDLGRRVLLLSIVDATARRHAADRKEVLIGELHHRIKNIMSLVEALARQTRTEGRSAEEYRSAFLDRFDALSRSLEVSSGQDATGMAALTHAVLEPYLGRSTSITIEDGPPVTLASHQVMPLGMILHELATNALKYGALSGNNGRLAVGWCTPDEHDGTSFVRLGWRESGGPPVAPPAAKGFGTRLIEVAAEHQLGGEVELRYEPDGLSVTLSFPRE